MHIRYIVRVCECIGVRVRVSVILCAFKLACCNIILCILCVYKVFLLYII